MLLSDAAKKRLEGLWGSYDFNLIRDRHFLTASDMVERFLETYRPWWGQSEYAVDKELLRHPKSVRRLVTDWAERKLTKIIESASAKTIQAHIMFKQLHYGPDECLNFGSIGTNWKKKAEIASELALYRPWSVAHACAAIGGVEKLCRHARQIVESSHSPSEKRFFDRWWQSSEDLDRPMLFPQVWGHTSGKMWFPISDLKMVPVHFDFGVVNTVRKTKVLIECDSRRYHSTDQRYQSDRDRQNIAERLGWSVRRFTYEDIMHRIEGCFQNLRDVLSYR